MDTLTCNKHTNTTNNTIGAATHAETVVSTALLKETKGDSTIVLAFTSVGRENHISRISFSPTTNTL